MTMAGWLLVAIAALFVAAVAAVVGAGRSLARKQRRLSGEIEGLMRDLDGAVGSVSLQHSDARRARPLPTAAHSARYPGYHRRDESRQEEVDHG